MDSETFFKLFLIALPFFILGDLMWLGVIAKTFYQSRLAHLLGKPNYLAAGVFYLVFTMGLTFFVLYPSATRGTVASSFVLGALFGFFTYATYNLTNWSTLRDWPFIITFVDLIWGTFLVSFVSVITYFTYVKFF